ncbi:polyketide cyclase [Pragia fontium]|uniref:Polyketide cyclase n=1 Tax=Pragia fontium TaxID=82985 RepID=A0ABQ5LNF7_9GAMM|nr:ester cyclase [Pragia fontium]GKX64163.1 polyketide cyclase [Pragia fontium]
MKSKLLFSLLLLTFSLVGHAATESQQELNKQVVTKFYQQALNDKDGEAAAHYLGKVYIQHNPNAQDGVEGFKKYIDYLKKNSPNGKSEIKQVFAEGDYVILHVKSTRSPEDNGQAIIDIFRLENGKIVEHWDVIQAIPKQSANGNGMF